MSLVNPLQMPSIYTSDVAVSSSDRGSSSRRGEGPGLSCLLVSRQSVLNMTRKDYCLSERAVDGLGWEHLSHDKLTAVHPNPVYC